MPLVINGLGGGHTDTHTHTHTDARTKAISRNQARAAFGCAPGLKILSETKSARKHSQMLPDS